MKIIITFLLLFIYALSFCQVEFEHLTDKDGLTNTCVTSIIKDSYGYIWAGTFNGLSRYNGYTFTNYLHDPKNASSITDNNINFVYETRGRDLIIGFVYAGICIFNRESETFTRFKHDDKNPASLSSNYILCIHEDKKGNIWIGTRAGFDKFNIETATFTHYTPIWNDKGFVSGIAEDSDGTLWLYGRGSQLCKFNPSNNKFESIDIFPNVSKSFTRGGAIKFDSRGYLWIGSEVNGLFRYNPRSGKKDWYSVQNNKLKANIVFSIIEDSEGKIWVATDGGGVCRYSYTNDSMEVFENDPDNTSSLSGNGVYCIYESDPGVIWIGVYSGGVNVYKKYKKKFMKYTAVGMPGHRLSQRTVFSFAENRDGKIWIGTDGGGLNLFDPKTQLFKYYTTKNSNIHTDKVKAICIDKENNLWLGSYGNGLCKFNFEKGTSRVFRGNLDSRGQTILGDHAWTLVESADNKIWIGLLNYGIQVYDPIKDTFTHYPFDSTAFHNEVASVHVLFQDSKNRIWIGMKNYGTGYFDPVKKTFVKFKSDLEKPGSLSSNVIRDIFEDSKGNIWIATFMGGLNKLVNVEKGCFVNYTREDGLASDNVQNIQEDHHHNLWLSTDKGITLFKVDENKFINFTLEDGLQSLEYTYHSSLKTHDGYIYFGGIQGFNMFHPDSIHFNTAPPKVILTDFKVFDKSLKPHERYNDKIYLSKAISLLKELTLYYKDNVFSVEFAALDFTSPQKNKYAYKLHGFNSTWTYVGADKRFATYTNLNPGEYTFQVIAANNDGYWNNKGVSLKIIILPPWWMTWWFRLSVVLLLISLFALFYYLRLKSIKARNSFLEEEVKKRTRELEESNQDLIEINEEVIKQQEEIILQKNELEHRQGELEKKQQELELLNKTKDKFFSIIGHDLKGPVKALTSLTTLLKEETATMSDKPKMLINHIDTASHKVQNLVISLLEWARSQSQQVKMDPAVISVAHLLKENVELLSQQALQKQIHLEVQTQEEDLVYADYNMISTVVRNILSNSIKYTPKGGIITLSSSIANNGATQLAIKDSGIGMSAEVLEKLFSLEKKSSVKGTDNETGTGLGMLIAKEFVELNKGKLYAESEPGKGSTFYLILPCGKQC